MAFYHIRPPALLIKLVFWLVVLAGLWTLVLGDLDEFEARTGFFDWAGRMIIIGIVAVIGLIAAAYAAMVVALRIWGEKVGIVSAILATLIALFCFSALWHGGA